MTTVLTLLPGGGYAEHAWGSTTDAMRRSLVDAWAAPKAPVRGHARTVLGLVQRDLIAVGSAGGEFYITTRGVALVEWARARELV